MIVPIALLTLAAVTDSVPRVVWSPCDLAAPGDGAAECATVTLPLDHASPSGPTLRIAVKRRPAAGAEVRQLWFVDGGPGDAGTRSLGRIAPLFDSVPGLAIYAFDHRGVGGSSPLECPAERAARSPDGAELTEKEWPSCVDHLLATRGDLPFLTVTQAARDLDRLISGMRVPGAAVTVWGISYGSFLVWEYLRLAATPPDAVIQDGIVPVDWSFAEFDASLDRAGRQWLELCRADSACRARLGDDPVAFSFAAAESVAAGRCGQLGLTAPIYRLVLGNLLMAGDPYRRLIPVVAWRVRRCEPKDRKAIAALFGNLFESGEIGEDSAAHNPIAQRHLALSALWPVPGPDSLLLAAALDSVVMTTAVSSAFARSRGRWPVARGVTSLEWPRFDGPMLLLHGELDPTMPLDRLNGILGAYRGAGKTFIAVPWAGHVTINENPCIRSVYVAFLRAPGVVDAACLTGLTSPVVLPDTALAELAFNTDDIWGDRPPSPWPTVFVGFLLVGMTGLAIRWVRRRRALM